MAEKFFRFRQFIVQQGRCAMKGGIDGVLLGAWDDISGTERILDAGSGWGSIALMLAQRTGALIGAVETDKASCDQSVENIKRKPLANTDKSIPQHIPIIFGFSFLYL